MYVGFQGIGGQVKNISYTQTHTQKDHMKSHTTNLIQFIVVYLYKRSLCLVYPKVYLVKLLSAAYGDEESSLRSQRQECYTSGIT